MRIKETLHRRRKAPKNEKGSRAEEQKRERPRNPDLILKEAKSNHNVHTFYYVHQNAEHFKINEHFY